MADRERVFSTEVLTSIRALGQDADHHSFDDVGKVSVGQLRPADRESTYRGSHFLLELKAVTGPTLPFSALKRHQVRALVRKHRAGGFGLVLVKRVGPRPKAWAIPAQLLLEHDLDLGARGSFRLGGPGQLELRRIPDPRGWKGRVWDLRSLFDDLIRAKPQEADS